MFFEAIQSVKRCKILIYLFRKRKTCVDLTTLDPHMAICGPPMANFKDSCSNMDCKERDKNVESRVGANLHLAKCWCLSVKRGFIDIAIMR